MDISIWFFNEPIVQSNAIVHVCQDLEWQIIMEKSKRKNKYRFSAKME